MVLLWKIWMNIVALYICVILVPASIPLCKLLFPELPCTSVSHHLEAGRETRGFGTCCQDTSSSSKFGIYHLHKNASTEVSLLPRITEPFMMMLTLMFCAKGALHSGFWRFLFLPLSGYELVYLGSVTGAD